MWFTETKEQVQINNNVLEADKGTILTALIILILAFSAYYRFKKYLGCYIRNGVTSNEMIHIQEI